MIGIIALIFCSDDASGLLGSVTLQKTVDELEPLSDTVPDSMLARHDVADFLSACVRYRLPPKRSHDISVSQASALAYHLLQRHNEQNRIKGMDKSGSAVVTLNCCQGLFDSPHGPVCVVAVNSNPLPSKNIRNVATNDGGEEVLRMSGEGIWVLLLKFRDLEQWEIFMGLDSAISGDKSDRLVNLSIFFTIFKFPTII